MKNSILNLRSCVILIVVLYITSIRTVEQSKDWDSIVFTRTWGFTECQQFKDESHGKLKCRFEGKPSIWTIHGVWPSKSGTEGPSYCTKVTFDEDLIRPIEDELNEHWYEINEDKDGTTFWTHEWTKHGSCAKELPQMDSELKYFQTGLQLNNQYDLYSILKAGGVIPQASASGYHLQDILKALEKELKVIPYVQCYETKEEGARVYHLLAIELCFNRSFQPISCTHTNSQLDDDENSPYGGSATKCPNDVPIIYTDNFPKTKQQSQEL